MALRPRAATGMVADTKRQIYYFYRYQLRLVSLWCLLCLLYNLVIVY